MSAIAETAGIATGSLYNYFSSKDELVLEIYRRIARETNRDVVDKIDPSLPFEDRLMAYLLNYIDFIWSDPTRARLLDYLTNVPLILDSEAENIFGKMVEFGKQLAREGQDDAALKIFPPELTNSFVRGAIRNLLKRMRASGTKLTPRLRQDIADMCRDAISTEPGKTKSNARPSARR
jgi:AcrR family transcriptional regulator